MSEKNYFEVLEEKPDVRPKREVTVAEQIVLAYIDEHSQNDYVAIDFSKVKGQYKSPQSLARMIGKMLRKHNLKKVMVASDEIAVYLLRQ